MSKTNQVKPDAAMGGAIKDGRPSTTTTWLLNNLRSDILSGRLSEGTSLRQEEIASSYGISRMPVREALLALAAEGWIIHERNKGAFVAPLDPNEVEEIFDIRGALEALALRKSLPKLTNEQKRAATRALDQLEAADSASVATAHRAFHLALYAAAGDRLLKLVRHYLDAAERYLVIEDALLPVEDDNRDEHKMLLAAAVANDVEGAVELIKPHVESAGKDLANALRSKRNQIQVT